MDVRWHDNRNDNNLTYSTLKEQLTPWRTSKYIPSLKKTGANIFEWNCGLGLNLFMTYEIIHQSKDDIRDVHLYGSTTSSSSSKSSSNTNSNDDSMMTAVAANLVLDTLLQKEANFVGGGKRGMICPTGKNNNNNNRHPWMDASFIPDNSFDLVYASDVPSVRDIWDTDTNLVTNDEYVQRQIELCRTKDTDWKSSILYQKSQEQQEELYGQYVSEMIRITKPGNVIAMEHVPIPFCDVVIGSSSSNSNKNDELLNYLNSGAVGGGGTGIAPSFWYRNQTFERYHWDDIDRSSIEIEMDVSSVLWWHDNGNDNLNNNGNYTHYHVVMKKVKR